MRSFRMPAALAVAATLGLAACGGAGGQHRATGGTFTMAVGTDLGNLDPYQTTMSLTRLIGTFLYDRLVAVDADGEARPHLATTWRADARSAAFTLRKGVTCADGAPLTASDIAAALNYVADPAHSSPLLGLWVQPGTRASADDAAGTVTVTSGRPDPFLVNNLGSVPIVCRSALADPRQRAAGKGGTGLYTVTEIVGGDHYTLTRRKDYAWAPDIGTGGSRRHPDTVVARVVISETTAANMLLSGQLNFAAVFGADRRRLEARKLFKAESVAPAAELYFNQAKGHPGADLRVRQAVVRALDLAMVGKVATGGMGTPMTQILASSNGRPVCAADTVTGNVPAFDLAAATSALDRAGWKPGPDGVRVKDGVRLSFTLPFVTSPGNGTAAAELMQQQLKAAGVELLPKGGNQIAINEAMANGSWDLMAMPIVWHLPTQMIPWFSGKTFPEGGSNLAGARNPTYEELAAKASTMPGKQGCALWNQAETALVRNLDVVPFQQIAQPVYGNGARFRLDLLPFTIEMDTA
ncbi:ABC transporter substrate-binding protein [Microtetraspora fusca]|uniref:ABC transporter substrate-binding protein n=1 Tax=Microtetraspora fusca TaxID=1997 RepID=A0ABW6UW85_MICFU